MNLTLVLVVIVTLQFCITFSAVAGGCYNDSETLDESSRYDNCDTCYETLANALIDTADNKYQLGEMFSQKMMLRLRKSKSYICLPMREGET